MKENKRKIRVRKQRKFKKKLNSLEEEFYLKSKNKYRSYEQTGDIDNGQKK